MTNHGSSLLQARKSHLLRHSLKSDSSSSHLHKRNSRRLRPHADIKQPRQFEAADLEPSVIEVVQTVSVVHVIDSNGRIIEAQTIYDSGMPVEPAEVTVPPEFTEPSTGDIFPPVDPAYLDTLLPAATVDVPTVHIPPVELPTSLPLDSLLPSLVPTSLTSAPSTSSSLSSGSGSGSGSVFNSSSSSGLLSRSASSIAW